MNRLVPVLLFIFLLMLSIGCSTTAYMAGYNLVALQEKKIGLDIGKERSSTAETILTVETIASTEVNPLQIVTIPAGIALAPIFFFIGNIAGAIENIPAAMTPLPERPLIEKRKLAHLSRDPDTLAILALDMDRPVRRAIAANENTPVKVLMLLADDQEWQVRRAVAKNTKSSANILIKLAHDTNLEVQYTARQNSKAPQSIRNIPDQKISNKGWLDELPYLEKLQEWWK